MHKSGFVSIIGMPNSGKSTLVNAIMGQKMSIVTPKPQTTRQRIFSIWNEDQLQIIYNDLPGWIENEKYTMHKLMNDMVRESEDDSDLLLIIQDPTQKNSFADSLLKKIEESKLQKLFVINKIDRLNKQELEKAKSDHEFFFGPVKTHFISALNQVGITELKTEIESLIPEHEPYFSKDFVSDKPIRFFLAEIIREQILLIYEEEIPYSIYVEVDSCKGVDEQEELARIEATIYVNRKSQVPIMLGKGGLKIKDLGIKSRLEMEKYLNQRVYIGLSIKVKENWRDDKSLIERKGILK
ncbi:MAG: GTPase Era [Saprospiraceae bacterium]